MTELTKEELGQIEQTLDSLGIPSGVYRDGFRDCLKMMVRTVKSKEFADMMTRVAQQAFFAALEERGIVLIPVDVRGLVEAFRGVRDG